MWSVGGASDTVSPGGMLPRGRAAAAGAQETRRLHIPAEEAGTAYEARHADVQHIVT